MKKLLFVALFGAFGTLYAAGLDTSAFAQGERNYFAIGMFLVFVLATLAITYFSSKKSQSAAGFYTAGGNITGMQNGIAIAGDFMSAASFLGIVGLVFANGFDGLIYAIGFFGVTR